MLLKVKDNDGINRRRHGRLHTESLTINAGIVLDLSASGFRALLRGKISYQVGDQASFRLKSCARAVSLDGHVVWVRKAGFRKHQIGVEFVNLTPESVKLLMQLTRDAMLNRVLLDSPG